METAELEQLAYLPDAPAPAREVVDGGVVVEVTETMALSVVLNAPNARFDAFAHGVVHALRPESRDRIRALVKREFARRRKERLKAGRLATRMARP